MFKYLLVCALFVSAFSLDWLGTYHILDSTSNNTRCQVPEKSAGANISMLSVLGQTILTLEAPIQGSGVIGQWSLGWKPDQVNGSNCLLHAWCINGTLTEQDSATFAHISWSFAQEHIYCDATLTKESAVELESENFLSN